MSLEHIRLAFATQTPGHAAAKLVLLALAEHADKKTGACYPSHQRLAEMTGLSRRCVVDQISILQTAGLLMIVKRPGVCAEYVLNLAPACEPASHVPVNSVHTPPVNLVHNGCEPSSHPPVNSTQHVYKEPSLEPSSNPRERDARWYPENLQTDRFKAKWAEWEDHLQQSNKPITNGTRRGQLSDCQRAGEPRSLIVIDAAITKGWKSLVWDFDKDRTHAPTAHKHGKLREQDKRPIIRL